MVALPAAVGLALAIPVATWWLLGPRSSPAIGIGSVVLVAITAGWLIRLSVRRRLDRRWWSVLEPILIAGIIAGLGWRSLTTEASDDALAAGLVVTVAGPVVAALLLYAGLRAWRLRSATHRRY